MPSVARWALGFVMLAMAAGCGSSSRLEAVRSEVETRPATRVDVGFRLLDEAGSPIAAVPVSLSLDPPGAAGARLEETSLETDESGRVFATLITGDEGTFAVIALAPGADAVRVPVAVTPPEYAYCSNAFDCEAPQQCLELRTSESAGAFCTVACTTDSECPIRGGFTGVCLDADTLGGTCYQECNVDADCLGSSACMTFTDASDRTQSVCLPSVL